MDTAETPWKILNDKKVYANQWIDVTEYQVLNPAGGEGIYGKVSFKNIAIGIIPLDEPMKSLLVLAKLLLLPKLHPRLYDEVSETACL